MTIMLVELMVFVPSVAKYRADYLRQRLAAAQIAAMSLTEAENGALSADLEKQLLATAGVEGVVLDLGDRAELILSGSMPTNIVDRDSVDGVGIYTLIRDAWQTWRRGGNAIIEVRGRPVNSTGVSIAMVLSEQGLYNAMRGFAVNTFIISLLISGITGALIYWFLYGIIVRPVWRLVGAMDRFREDPADPRRVMQPETRRDEMGMMGRELARMQIDVHAALGQRRRLALLGEAVSKINHDLRNILASAQLSSDSLSDVDDPQVRRISERLIKAIDRAIALCERTLKFGKAEESEPEKCTVDLFCLVEEVGLSLTQVHRLRWVNDVPPGFRLFADPEHLFRMLLNLARNAADALANEVDPQIAVTVEAGKDRAVVIRLCDNGPGVPEQARANLFVPFAGSVSQHGTGLGLVIVRELMEAHGGQVALEKSDGEGATFALFFPAGSAMDQPRRARRAS